MTPDIQTVYNGSIVRFNHILIDKRNSDRSLVADKASADKTFREMADRVPAGRVFALHMNMIRLGREICRARNPRCPDCPLRAVCDYAEENS